MPVFGIVLAVLLVLCLIPLGVDAAYDSTGFSLAAKIGPFYLTLFPRPVLTPEAAARKAEKAKKKALKKKEKAAKKAEAKKTKPRKKLDKEFILALVRMGVNALRRFGKKLTVDQLRLHWTAAADDPFDAAVQYGRICALLHTVPQLAESVLRIRERDLQTNLSFETNKPVIQARCVLVIRVGEILWVGLAFGVEFLIWKIRHRSARSGAERKVDNGK